MKKIIIVVSVLAIILVILFSNNFGRVESIGKKISSVEVAQYEYKNEGTSMKPSIIKTWTLSDKETIDRLIKALNNKTKTNAKIDIRPRDYSVKINYSDKSADEYDLWVGEENHVRGVLMKGRSTWFINAESNSVFKEILK